MEASGERKQSTMRTSPRRQKLTNCVVVFLFFFTHFTHLLKTFRVTLLLTPLFANAHSHAQAHAAAALATLIDKTAAVETSATRDVCRDDDFEVRVMAQTKELLIEEGWKRRMAEKAAQAQAAEVAKQQSEALALRTGS
jgi:hypothetical protein